MDILRAVLSSTAQWLTDVWSLPWRWKGLALGSAAAVLIALAVGVVLVSGGDGDSPAVLGLRAASPTATTNSPSTPLLTPGATVSPHPTPTIEPNQPPSPTITGPSPGVVTPPATSEETPTAPAPKATPTPAPGPTATPVPGPSDAVLVGAGDIASCSSPGDEATAKLLDTITGTVFTTGDNAYDSGTASEFANCYQPSWGRHKARTRPAAGNHDYETAGATGYYNYFGAAAGVAGKGYYSYNLGTWHVIVLNSNCSQVGGCDSGSAQEQWLRADLAAHPTQCTVAYWHRPRYSSGDHHGSSTATRELYQALYDANADLIVTGHEHNYERFKPQDANGNLNTARGIRQFVVGTGGRSHYGFGSIIANSEVRNSDTSGVIKLTLRSGSYDWSFIPEAGKAFTDSGSQACH